MVVLPVLLAVTAMLVSPADLRNQTCCNNCLEELRQNAYSDCAEVQRYHQRHTCTQTRTVCACSLTLVLNL